jgi:hypothetical protein
MDMPSETEFFKPIFGSSKRRSVMPSSMWGESGRNGTRTPMLGMSGLRGMDLETLAGKELENIK